MDSDTNGGVKERATTAFMLVFSIYLVVGALVTFYTGKWFIGFPAQLDIAYFLFGQTTIGAYIEGGLAGAIGGAILWGFIRHNKRGNAV